MKTLKITNSRFELRDMFVTVSYGKKFLMIGISDFKPFFYKWKQHRRIRKHTYTESLD